MHARQRPDQPADRKADDQELDEAFKNTPKFNVTAPAFCASASVGCDGPFNVTKIFVKSMPPTRRPMIGVKMSFTRLFTTAVNATPMTMPIANARNSSSQVGRHMPVRDEVCSLIDNSFADPPHHSSMRASASMGVWANGIDQRCGRGEARSLTLVDGRDDGHAPAGELLKRRLRCGVGEK